MLHVSNGFRPEEAPFNFLLLTYNGEVTKMIRPWVADLKIPRHTFHRYCYRYQYLNVSRWSIIRCSYDEHSNFFWGKVTWRDLVIWHWVTRLGNFQNMCGKKCMNRFVNPAALRAAVFLDICDEPEWGVWPPLGFSQRQIFEKSGVYQMFIHFCPHMLNL